MWRAYFVAIIVLATAPVSAWEQDGIGWSQVSITLQEREELGSVTFVAEVREDVWRVVKIDAFDREFELDEEQRTRLAGFPLSSLQTYHGPGPEDNYYVVFKFRLLRWEEDRLVLHEVSISVSRTNGLKVSEPQERVIREREG